MSLYKRDNLFRFKDPKKRLDGEYLIVEVNVDHIVYVGFHGYEQREDFMIPRYACICSTISIEDFEEQCEITNANEVRAYQVKL